MLLHNCKRSYSGHCAGRGTDFSADRSVGTACQAEPPMTGWDAPGNMEGQAICLGFYGPEQMVHPSRLFLKRGDQFPEISTLTLC